MVILSDDKVKYGMIKNPDPKNEPSDDEISDFLAKNPGHSWYTAREKLREQAYGGRPPGGFQSWGDYWKAY